MKLKILFVMLFAVSLSVVNAQLRKIPAEATNAFKTKFPKAADVSWHDRISAFRAEFKVNGELCEADFSGKGEWIRTQRYINYDKLPADVIDGIKKSKYANWTAKEVVQVEEAGKELQYRINVRVNQNTGARRDLYFKANGQLVKDSFSL